MVNTKIGDGDSTEYEISIDDDSSEKKRKNM